MPDFRRRSRETELMDEGGISFEEFHHCLRELETINHLTLAYRPTLRWLRPWLPSDERLTILDAGSGGGDMLRQICKQLPQSSSVQLIGVDLNPWSKRSAERCEPCAGIEYATADIFEFQPEQPIDIIVCSLFTHHLTEEQLVQFLRWLDQRAQKGWFINDLHRHPLPYYFIKLATRLLSRNRLVRNDAAVSVARSFSKSDWRRLLMRAEIPEERVQLRWHFPFRLCLSCTKAVPHESPS